MPHAKSARESLASLLLAAKGVRPGVRFFCGAIAGGWVGLATALAAGPWGPEERWHEAGIIGPSLGQIVEWSVLGGLLVVLATWIPHRLARSVVVATAGGLLLHLLARGWVPGLFAGGLAGVSWTLEAAVSPPWFARGRARGLLVVLAAATGIAVLTATRGLPAQLPHEAGSFWLVAVLSASTSVSCLLHALHDVLAVRLIARVGDAFEERDEPEGAVDAVATPGGRGGRIYLGRLPVPQGRGAYQSGQTGVPVVQLLTSPAIARRWLAASALGLALTGALLLGLAAHTSAALAGREGAMRRFLVDPPAVSTELRAPEPGPPG